MSTNCINCVVNKRTGPDLLCDECRTTSNPVSAEVICIDLAIKGWKSGLTEPLLVDALVKLNTNFENTKRELIVSKQATKHAIELVDTVSKERDAWKAMAKNLLVGFKQYADEVCSCTFDHDLNECTHVCLEHKLMNEFRELDKP